MKKGLIEIIIKEIVKKLSSFESIKSLTLVGSYPDADIKPTDRIIDLDFIIIFDSFTVKTYHKISLILNKITKKFSNNSTELILEKKIGPFKPKKKKKNLIIIHLIFFDIKEYQDYSKKNPLAAYSWQRFKPLIKKPLKEIYNVKSIKTKDIIKKRLGIEYYLKTIKTKRLICLTYKQKNKRIQLIKKRITLSKKETLQLIYHGIFHSVNNMFKVIENKNLHLHYSWKPLIKRLFKEFPTFKNYNNFLKALNESKDKIRSGKEIRPRDIKTFESKGISFLKQLEEILKKRDFLKSKRTKQLQKTL